MRKRDMTFASAVLEAIDALLALAYIGLQIYYGVCYHIQVFKFVANILVLLLVYIAITWLQHYPEKLNHIAAELCVGNIRKYSLRLLMFVKLVFTAGLLVDYENELIDKYENWQKELEKREKAVEEREKALDERQDATEWTK